MVIRIERYDPGYKTAWNQFVKESKNGFFLFEREYMDYHSDRFIDHSILFYKEDELLGVLPANEKENALHSHGGLTFGGLIMSRRTSSVFVQAALAQMIVYLRKNNFHSFTYKSIPFIYHQLPAQEDLYALFKNNAQLYRRDISSVIDLNQKIFYTKGTKSNLNKARKNNLSVEKSEDFETFMAIQEEILRTKYNTKPTHTAAELKLLSSSFSENIQLFLIKKEDKCLGGTLLYITDLVAHAQYIGITDEGKEVGALDFLTDTLLQNFIGNKRYYSFGISTEQEGCYLNEGLIKNKESFGARAVVHDFYKLALS